jgi:Na+/H+ antiporter NhaC
MALFIPLLIYLTFFGLLYAYLITWLIIIRRSDTYKAFRRSAVAKIKRPAKASYFFFLLWSALPSPFLLFLYYNTKGSFIRCTYLDVLTRTKRVFLRRNTFYDK